MSLAPASAAFRRIRSVDILRGAIMVLMAIDHVRVYSGIPAGGPEPGIFFTRWVTHFCAPGFVFFAGTSAFLYGRKVNNTNALSRFLLTRGILLVILELTLIRFCWTFNFDYAGFTLAGVIWMLGCCMVLMALLVKLKPVTAGIAGVVIIAVQQVFSYVPQLLPQSSREAFGRFWEFIYTSGLEGPQGITILYVIVPWIGVMAAGYAFGMILQMEPARRNKICLRIGLSAIALFLITGSIIVLNKPASPDAPPFILRLLNQNKYPASQLYLLMTLGPLIALVPFAEKAKGWLAAALEVFGKVPMFYYLLHIPLIHISALVVNLIRTGSAHSEWYNTAPYVYFENENDRWGPGLLYLVFIINVALLYFLCRWYAKYKAVNPGKRWLRYL
ncbi:MAG: heparan-alpha-glucosaminide N-acetyltransferase domain-containing protein [Chitinophagaceae bacterium]|nr:heparan-alpha-glucosaminide N-acetyltransferase domain-containing protein [Chitinophagaceae bacterium]